MKPSTQRMLDPSTESSRNSGIRKTTPNVIPAGEFIPVGLLCIELNEVMSTVTRATSETPATNARAPPSSVRVSPPPR